MKKAFPAVAVFIALFSGGRWAWGEAAYRYFRHQCETRAGEFIYSTVENVEGIYQARLRDPEDYFDRMRRGDFPEDPFGHTNAEAQTPWHMFLQDRSSGITYQYFETTLAPGESLQRLRSFRFENKPQHTGEKYWRYRRLYESKDDAGHNNMTAEQTSVVDSDYGFTWREVRGRWARLAGVYGGELVAIRLATQEEIAIRRGFILVSNAGKRFGICPRDKTDYMTARFLRKVLIPAAERGGKSPEAEK